MKQLKIVLVLTLSSLALVSSGCASKTVSADKGNKSESETPVIEEVKITPEQEFINSLENVSLAFTQSPKETAIGKEFSSAYVIQVLKNGTPLSGLSVTIEYPSAKTDGVISTAQEIKTSDEQGFVTFEAAIPAFSAKALVQAYPTPAFDNEEVNEACVNLCASAEYKVKSDVAQKGCLLFVWDFNEKGKALSNNYDIQSEFRKKGVVLCGNAPINETSYIGKPLSTLYKENYEIVEDMYGYLIVGTVKYTKPVEEMEDGSGYLCSMVAEISAINMKNGNKVFEQTFTNETVGSNWQKSTSTCKSELGKEIVDALIYGL